MQKEKEIKSIAHPLGTEKISSLLLKFSIPCILSLLVSSLYNIVDQIFIGQSSVGYLGNAATNVVYPVTVIALAFSLLIGEGCGALFSLSLGKGDKETGRKAVGNSIITLIIVSLIIMILGYVFQSEVLTLFGVTDNCYDYAKDYLSIILIGIPFFMFTIGGNVIIRVDGSPKYSMIAMVVGAVINIILDPIAIFALDWGMKGAAIATVIGQVASCIMTVLYLRKPKSFTFHKSSFKLSGKLIAKFSIFGLSSFITQLSIVVAIAVMNNVLITYGVESKYGADIPLSVLGIVMKVYGIIISIIVGIAVGGQPIIGFNYGAGNYDRVLKTYKYVVIAAGLVGVVGTGIFQLCPQIIINIFGSESDLYNELATLCFRIFLGGLIFSNVQKVSGIFLQSIGKPVKAMIISLSRDIVFILPLAIILPRFFGVVGLFWSAPLADVLSFSLTVIFISIEYKKFKKLSTNRLEVNTDV